MRGGVRLLALVAAIGLLAGCSDPAGALRREQAAARKRSPTPTPQAKRRGSTGWRAHKTMSWWQAPGGTRTSAGLRVRASALRSGRMTIVVTDVRDRVSRTITATPSPRAATVGHFTLTAIKVAKSPRSGTYGIGFRYRRR